MFVDPFAMKPTAGVLAAPVLSNRVAWMKADTVQWGPNAPASQAYTSSAGNVLFLGCARSTTVTTRNISEDWNGDAMTELATAKQDGALNLSCDAAIKAGGFVGAGTAHAAHPADATDRFRFLLAWLYDLDQVRGGIGGTAATAIAVAQEFVEVSLPVSQIGSLLIAAAWCQQENMMPFAWTAGWSKLDEQQLGTGDQPCGSIASKTSTATGSQTVRMSGTVAGVSSTAWAIAAVELLPG